MPALNGKSESSDSGAESEEEEHEEEIEELQLIAKGIFLSSFTYFSITVFNSLS